MATVTEAPVSDASPEVAPAQPGLAIRGMAVGLWAVVGTLLGYGILQTAIKAAALFG